MLLPRGAWAADPPDWLDSSRDRLAGGEIVTRTHFDDRSVSVEAAVRVRARPEQIWALITNCESAAVFIPGLRHCALLQTASDGSWAIIEHDVKYSLWMPVIHTLFHAQYQRPFRIELWRVGGDLKRESGAWRLIPSADGEFTTVESDLTIEPGFWVPHGVMRFYLNKQLPAALSALRARVEHPPVTANSQR